MLSGRIHARFVVGRTLVDIIIVVVVVVPSPSNVLLLMLLLLLLLLTHLYVRRSKKWFVLEMLTRCKLCQKVQVLALILLL